MRWVRGRGLRRAAPRRRGGRRGVVQCVRWQCCDKPWLSSQHSCGACVNATCVTSAASACERHGTVESPVECSSECWDSCVWAWLPSLSAPCLDECAASPMLLLVLCVFGLRLWDYVQGVLWAAVGCTGDDVAAKQDEHGGVLRRCCRRLCCCCSEYSALEPTSSSAAARLSMAEHLVTMGLLNSTANTRADLLVENGITSVEEMEDLTEDEMKQGGFTFGDRKKVAAYRSSASADGAQAQAPAQQLIPPGSPITSQVCCNQVGAAPAPAPPTTLPDAIAAAEGWQGFLSEDVVADLLEMVRAARGGQLHGGTGASALYRKNSGARAQPEAAGKWRDLFRSSRGRFKHTKPGGRFGGAGAVEEVAGGSSPTPPAENKSIKIGGSENESVEIGGSAQQQRAVEFNSMAKLCSFRSKWSAAVEANGMIKCGALAIGLGLAKMLLWHAPQPVLYFWVFAQGFAILQPLQQVLGCLVAVRVPAHHSVLRMGKPSILTGERPCICESRAAPGPFWAPQALLRRDGLGLLHRLQLSRDVRGRTRKVCCVCALQTRWHGQQSAGRHHSLRRRAARRVWGVDTRCRRWCWQSFTRSRHWIYCDYAQFCVFGWDVCGNEDRARRAQHRKVWRDQHDGALVADFRDVCCRSKIQFVRWGCYGPSCHSGRVLLGSQDRVEDAKRKIDNPQPEPERVVGEADEDRALHMHTVPPETVDALCEIVAERDGRLNPAQLDLLYSRLPGSKEQVRGAGGTRRISVWSDGRLFLSGDCLHGDRAKATADRAKAAKATAKATHAMIEAAGLGQAEQVDRLIRCEGADVNGMDEIRSNGTQFGAATALHWAAQNNHVGTLEVLKATGRDTGREVDLELKNRYGMTPLMAAARNGRTEAVQWLLEQRVDWRKTTKTGSSARLGVGPLFDGYTALDIAKKECHEEVVKALEAWAEAHPDGHGHQADVTE